VQFVGSEQDAPLRPVSETKENFKLRKLVTLTALVSALGGAVGESTAQAESEQKALSSDWACIHSYEGAWSANTGNGYYGGLQMDWDFMRAYGREFLRRWGTADRWPVWAQVTAAERAKRTRGYWPWPNSARYCGLL
jgi:hypothetical protein